MALAAALIALTVLLLLLASDLDRRDPPDWSLYGAIVMLSAWPPIWYVYTCLSWACKGATVGMRCVGLNVVDRAGSMPGVARSALRAGSLALLSAPILLSPFLVAAAAALGSAGPTPLVFLCTLSSLASLAACISPAVAADGRAWHDRISGTWVVRALGPGAPLGVSPPTN